MMEKELKQVVNELTTDTSGLSQREAYKLIFKDYPEVMSVEQVSEALRISTKTCYKILREGRLTSLKIGRAYRIPKIHVLNYLSIIS